MDEKLREVLSCDPQTGVITWKNHTYKSRIGSRAGSQRPDGYRYIKINGKNFYEHRLVWFFATGSWPKNDIDHINGNKSDNRIDNLRECTKSENQWNVGPQKNNSTGFKGVVPVGDRYKANIFIHGERIHLGVFDTIEDAAKARKAADKKLQGKFAKVLVE